MLNTMRSFLSLTLFLSLVSNLATSSCGRPIASDFQGTQSAHATAAGKTRCSLPFPNSYVSDYANVIDQSAKDELESKLQKLKSSGNIDFAVVFVETTDGQDIFDYSLALARCWGVGRKNPDKAGLLLLVAVKERKWRIQISRV